MNKSLFLVSLIGIFALLQTITCTPYSLKIPNDFVDLVDQFTDEEKFDLGRVLKAIRYLDNKKTDASVNKRLSYDQDMGQILVDYAKKLFYGKLSNNQPQIQKALFFFKLAASYQNAESLYYLSFYSFYNLDGRFLFKTKLPALREEDKRTEISTYIQSMNTTATINSAHQSSLQGYNASKYLIANMLLKGRGGQRNCPLAAAYFRELGDYLFNSTGLDEQNQVDVIEKSRLDSLYFQESVAKDNVPMLQENSQEMDYLSMSSAFGDVRDIIELGNTYYYGLRGQKKDYVKAFEYYQKATERGNPHAKTHLAKMLLKGVGTAKDIQRGVKYLEETAEKGDPRAKNLLGELYQNGDEGFPKNTTVALKYFKEAADLKYSPGLYNYGIALFLEGEKPEVAGPYIDSAAMQNYPLAIFQLGYNHLVKDSTPQGCELAAFLMKISLYEGPWVDKLKEGYNAFHRKNYKQAALYYMETALMGQEIGGVNAALIIDEFNVFEDIDLDILTILDDISSDPIYQALKSTQNFRQSEDLDDVLYGGLSNVLYNVKYTERKKVRVLKTLTESTEGIGADYRRGLITKLLKIGAEDQDPLSLLVLGDTYQTGKFGEKDYRKAYEQYKQIPTSRLGTFTPPILSQAYYNMAHMNHRGRGTPKNLTRAIEFYTLAGDYQKDVGTYLTLISKKVAELEKSVFGEEYERKDQKHVIRIISDAVKSFGEKFEETYAKKLLLVLVVICVVILYLARLRLTNYVNMELEKQKLNDM